MTGTQRYFLFRTATGVVLAMLMVMLLGAPYIFQAKSSLQPLPFVTEQQSKQGDALILQGSFARNVAEGEAVWVYAENALVEITASGTTHRLNGREATPAIFRSPGSGWYSFSGPAIQAGDPAEIAVTSYYGEGDRAVKNTVGRIYTGDGSGLLALLLRQVDFFGIVLICAGIAGIIYMLEGGIDILFGMKAGTRIFWFGLYFFCGALWCVPDVLYPYLPLLISPSWMAALVDVSGLILFPIALASMMQYYIRGKQTHRIMMGILWLEIGLAVFCLLLQLTGALDLIEQQLIIGGVALVSLGTAMVCVILELHSYRDRYLTFLFLSVLPVFCSEIMDGINLIWPFMPRRCMMRYSFGISILMLIFQFVSYANTELAKAERLRKVEQELANFRISAMLSQIKPHFLYNSLLGIKLLCDTDPARASEALGHFSFYLRGNLDSLVNTQLVSFRKELRQIEDYLFLEKMRFDETLNIEWDLRYTDFLLPPLTVQPLIENAIRHGLNPKDGGGTLTIRSEQVGQTVVITVQDDGVGFDPSVPAADGRTHIGIENTRNRLVELCGGSLEIESVENMGTVARITLPLGEAVV